MLSLLMPAVIEGVSSFTSRIVPAGASEIFTSCTPSSCASTPLFTSRTSAARWRMKSSAACEKIMMNMSHMLSKACSAH